MDLLVLHFMVVVQAQLYLFLLILVVEIAMSVLRLINGQGLSHQVVRSTSIPVVKGRVLLEVRGAEVA